ncbi:MAG: hypothetical protein M3256_21730 [Actinomycetota bacterium]|nr:hypothetical protein [Actinomycetota bacterium]
MASLYRGLFITSLIASGRPESATLVADAVDVAPDDEDELEGASELQAAATLVMITRRLIVRRRICRTLS